MRDGVDRYYDQVEYMLRCPHTEDEPIRGLEGLLRRRRGQRAYRCTSCGLETRVVRVHRAQ